MRTQFTIFKKGLTLIAIPLLVQAVFIAVLMKARVDRDRAQYWAIHTKEVIAKVEETHRSLVESDSRVRSLVLSGEPATSDLYRQATEQVPRQIEELRMLVSDNLRQTAPDRGSHRSVQGVPGLDRRGGGPGPLGPSGSGGGAGRPRRGTPEGDAGDHR